MKYRLPFLLGLAHGVSDASAGLLVGLIILQRSPQMNDQILLYNLLAFGLQPLAGIWFDRTRQPERGASAGLLLTLTGLLVIPFNLAVATLLVGLGSAGLHAGGGSAAITSTPGRASAPGIFAAFGVVGLTLGGIASLHFSTGARFALILLLVVLAVIIWFTPHLSSQAAQTAGSLAAVPLIIIALLGLAVALRSTVWVGTQMSVERYSGAALALALAAGTGKLLGGFAADYFGWQRWMLAALAAAGLLMIFAGGWLPALMSGALLLQSVTPLSIAAAGRALPKFPGLAASLVLGTAIIAGGLPFFMLAPFWNQGYLTGGWFGPGLLAALLLASAVFYGVALAKSQRSAI